jgi:peptidoglycan/LPS O-acetylase OafA/YrhL
VTKPPRQPHLSGLRGVAAIIVGISLCAEFVVPPGRGAPDMSLQGLLAYDFNMALAGFVIFFALSGYLIPAGIGGAHALRDFVFRRGMRLYPTFLVAGAAALCVLPLEPGMRPAARSVLKSFVVMRPLTTSEQFNHSHWVLLAVLVFYALCFAGAAAGILHKRGAALALAFGLLSLCGVFTVIGLLYHRHFPMAAVLCLAVAAYGAFVRQRQDTGDPGLSRTFMFITTAFWLALLLNVGLAWSPNWGMGEIWLGKAVAFAGGGTLFLYGVFRRRFTARSLMLIGDASYAMYLFLPLFLSVASVWIRPENSIARLGTAGAALATTFVVGTLTCRFVGKPASDLADQVVARDASAPQPRTREPA